MWIRTLLTVGGVGVLGLGLLWSVGGLRLGVVRTVRVKLVVFVVVCYQFHSALCLEGKTKMVRKSLHSETVLVTEDVFTKKILTFSYR